MSGQARASRLAEALMHARSLVAVLEKLQKITVEFS